MASRVKAMYDFSGEQGSSELSISAGEVLTVTRTDVGEGWWEGRNNKNQVGLFPAAYVQVMSSAEVEIEQRNVAVEENQKTGRRYDLTTDEYNDGDEWEDDWDEDNDTYSEISSVFRPGDKQIGVSNSTSAFESKNLPALPPENNSQHNQNIIVTNPAANTLKKAGMFGKSSDSYILGLPIKEKPADSEVVQVFGEDNFYHWQTITHAYSVVVASPKKESKFKGMKTFIAYQLTPSFNNISVSRRYKHFDWLHERLVEKFCLIPIPPLPDKQISGRYEEQFVEHRRVQLQEFVDWVCRHPVLSRCEVWHHFLTCTDDKMWKIGKRKAEKDIFVGVTYCWAISAPEKQLLQSYVDAQTDSFTHFTHAMDASIRNLLAISNDTIKRYQIQSKKEFQRIGDGLSDLAKALNIDERRDPSTSHIPLSEIFGKIGGVYIGIGQMYGDQPKVDWIPLSDRLHIYRGILNSFPDILSTHKGGIQKRKECEKLTAEQKMNNIQLADVNRRTDVISYAVFAEISHFKHERDTHLRQTLKLFIEEQMHFYSNVLARLQEAYQQFD